MDESLRNGLRKKEFVRDGVLASGVEAFGVVKTLFEEGVRLPPTDSAREEGDSIEMESHLGQAHGQ